MIRFDDSSNLTFLVRWFVVIDASHRNRNKTRQFVFVNSVDFIAALLSSPTRSPRSGRGSRPAREGRRGVVDVVNPARAAQK